MQENSDLEGAIEGISVDGEVIGWCWNARAPHERLLIEILLDGSPAGAVIAGNLRQDLLEAGIGDGRHAFRYFLPAHRIAGRGSITIAIRDVSSGQLIGAPQVAEFSGGHSLDRKVEKLEDDVQAAQATLRDVARDLDRAARAEPMRELLLTLGSFLQHAASSHDENRTSPLLGTLRSIIAEARERFSPLAFDRVESPSATLILVGKDHFEATYATLLSLKATGVDSVAEILLVDCDSSDYTVFSPLLLPNVRYLRAPDGSTDIEAINLAASMARAETLVVLTNDVQAERGWLEELLDTFAREASCVAVCPQVRHHDGVLASVGAKVQRNGQVVPIGGLDDPRRPEYSYLRAVDSVTWSAFAISRAFWMDVGGIDPLAEHGQTALADLCLKAAETERGVMCQPLARVTLRASTGKSGDDAFDIRSSEEESRQFLLRRWATLLRDERPVQPETALVIAENYAGAHTLVPDPLVEQMLVLRDLGYDVACVAAGDGVQDEELRQDLQRIGVKVLYPPLVQSPTDALERFGTETALVLFDGDAIASRYSRQVESMAPAARTILLQARTVDREQGILSAELTGAVDLVAQASLKAQSDNVDDPVPSVSFGYLGAPPISRPSFDSRHGICILEDFEDPKVQEAVDRFLTTVMPQIREQDPTVQLFVRTSRSGVRKVRASVTGQIKLVHDLKTLVRRVRLQVVPAGLAPSSSEQILAGILHGVPLIGGADTVESLGLTAGDGVVSLDDVNAMAQTVVRLHSDADGWTDLSRGGTQRLNELFGREAARDRIEAALTALERVVD